MQVTTWTDYSHREPKNEDLRETVANLFALCNDCNVSDGNLQGEPTEKALGEYAQSMGIDFAALRRDMPRVGEIPFSSARKRMTCLLYTSHTHQRDGIGKQYHRDIKSETEQYGQPHIFEGTVMVLTGALIEENDDENPHDGERDVSVNSP